MAKIFVKNFLSIVDAIPELHAKRPDLFGVLYLRQARSELDFGRLLYLLSTRHWAGPEYRFRKVEPEEVICRVRLASTVIRFSWVPHQVPTRVSVWPTDEFPSLIEKGWKEEEIEDVADIATVEQY